jgi:hypothetical protein
MDDVFSDEAADMFSEKDKDMSNEIGLMEEQRKQSQAGLDLLKRRMGHLQQTIYSRRAFLKAMQGKTDSDTPWNESRQEEEFALLRLANSSAKKPAVLYARCVLVVPCRHPARVVACRVEAAVSKEKGPGVSGGSRPGTSSSAAALELKRPTSAASSKAAGGGGSPSKDASGQEQRELTAKEKAREKEREAKRKAKELAHLSPRSRVQNAINKYVAAQ